jgi:hypothetical protein
MEPNLNERLMVLEEKLDSIWRSVEKTRRYFQITMWVTLAVVVLPLLGLIFIVPAMISALTGSLAI